MLRDAWLHTDQLSEEEYDKLYWDLAIWTNFETFWGGILLNLEPDRWWTEQNMCLWHRVVLWNIYFHVVHADANQMSEYWELWCGDMCEEIHHSESERFCTSHDKSESSETAWDTKSSKYQEIPIFFPQMWECVVDFADKLVALRRSGLDLPDLWFAIQKVYDADTSEEVLFDPIAEVVERCCLDLFPQYSLTMVWDFVRRHVDMFSFFLDTRERIEPSTYRDLPRYLSSPKIIALMCERVETELKKLELSSKERAHSDGWYDPDAIASLSPNEIPF